jgi:DNA-binding LacI/PurR family transcriptional regulator
MADRETVTIRDVARAAGVSPATVSAVINDRPNVRSSTRARVLSVIQTLDYRPLAAARNLRLKSGGADSSPRRVALIVKELRNPFYAEITLGAIQTTWAHDVLLLVLSSEGHVERERSLMQSIVDSGAQGVILAPVLNEDTDLSHVYDMKRSGMPLVLLEDVAWVKAPVVSVDNVEMAKRAAKYLIEGGHERIAHFAGPSYTAHSDERIAGFREAYSESRVAFSDHFVVRAGASYDDGYRVGMEYFSGPPGNDRPTAVTCFNDLLAIGLMRALAELGLSVPEDVSVIGYDDDPVAAFLPVPLTTVRTPNFEMGKQASLLLIEALNGNGADTPTRVRLDAELVVRASTRRLKMPATAS